MSSLATIREFIRKRPGMLIGKTGIANFEHWLMGIMTAEDVNNIKESARIFPCLTEFEGWLRKKHKTYSGARKSFGLALRKAKNDDVEAFYLWMKWYDEYAKEIIAEPGI